MELPLENDGFLLKIGRLLLQLRYGSTGGGTHSTPGYSYYSHEPARWGAKLVGFEVGENIENAQVSHLLIYQSPACFTKLSLIYCSDARGRLTRLVGAEMMIFNFKQTTRNCVSKPRNFVSKPRNFVLKMMNPQRQHGAPWHMQLSPWHGAAETSVCADGSAICHTGAQCGGREAGHSKSFLRRMFIYHWLAGSALNTAECCSCYGFDDGKGRTWNVSANNWSQYPAHIAQPNGQMLVDVFKLYATRDRGAVNAPLAIIIDAESGFGGSICSPKDRQQWGTFKHSEHHQGIYDLLNEQLLVRLHLKMMDFILKMMDVVLMMMHCIELRAGLSIPCDQREVNKNDEFCI